MNQREIEKYTVRRPDYIPENEEYLYPHLGGVFHDYVPDGETALKMHGPTEDAAPTAKVVAEEVIPKAKPEKQAS